MLIWSKINLTHFGERKKSRIGYALKMFWNVFMISRICRSWERFHFTKNAAIDFIPLSFQTIEYFSTILYGQLRKSLSIVLFFFADSEEFSVK